MKYSAAWKTNCDSPKQPFCAIKVIGHRVQQPALECQSRLGMGVYQTVITLDPRIQPSRLMTGVPKYTPVAATILSGMSGTSMRGIWRMGVYDFQRKRRLP